MKNKLSKILKSNIIVYVILAIFILFSVKYLRDLSFKIDDMETKVEELVRKNKIAEEDERKLIKQINDRNSPYTYEYSFKDQIIDNEKVTMLFSLRPKEVSENAVIYFVNDGKETKLNRNGRDFSNEIELNIKDEFEINLKIVDGDETKEDKIGNIDTGYDVGYLVFPKIDLVVDSKSIDYKNNRYSNNFNLNFRNMHSLNDVYFESIEYIFEVDGEIIQQDKIDTPRANYEGQILEIKTRANFSEDQLALAYIKAVDGYGFIHKIYLDVQGQGKELSDFPKHATVYTETGEEIFNYFYAYDPRYAE